MVEEIISSEVKNKLDMEFYRKVEEKAEKESEKKLAQKTDVEWPRWFNTYIQPNITYLENLIYTESLNTLIGPWKFPCDKCSSINV